MLPQINATLDAVYGPGFSEDYDRPAGQGPKLLSGPIDAYYRETVRTSYSQNEGRLVKSSDVQLIVPADLTDFDATDWKTGLIVVYTYRGKQTARRVQDYTDKWMPGLPNPTIRLHLDTAATDAPEADVEEAA